MIAKDAGTRVNMAQQSQDDLNCRILSNTGTSLAKLLKLQLSELSMSGIQVEHM